MINSRISKKISSSICKSNSISSCSVVNSLMQRLDLTTSTTKSTFSTMSNMKSSSGEEREVVSFIGLNNLSDNPGAVKRARRVGRGIGSSKGKTCGKGHKGQKARTGKGPSPLFEGGQTPFYKRIPKRGFTNKHAEPMVPINVGTLQDYIDMGRLVVTPQNQTQPFTMKDLVEAGITKNSSIKHGIKLLAKGRERLRTPFKIEISRASAGAIEAIESVGGEITTVHYNKLALRALLKPEKFEIIPKRARPPPKLMEYYTDYDKRGYLSAEKQLSVVQERLGLNNSVNDDDNNEDENSGASEENNARKKNSYADVNKKD